jgi:hypothetical protein
MNSRKTKIARQNNTILIEMEYKGLTELTQEIPTRGRYTRIAQQAIKDFQNKNIKFAKIDIIYTEEKEFKALYNSLKSLIRRKKISIKAIMQKDKTTNKRAMYLVQENL